MFRQLGLAQPNITQPVDPLTASCGPHPGVICRVVWDVSHNAHAADLTGSYLAGPVNSVLRIAFVVVLALAIRAALNRVIRRVTEHAAEAALPRLRRQSRRLALRRARRSSAAARAAARETVPGAPPSGTSVSFGTPAPSGTATPSGTSAPSGIATPSGTSAPSGTSELSGAPAVPPSVPMADTPVAGDLPAAAAPPASTTAPPTGADAPPSAAAAPSARSAAPPSAAAAPSARGAAPPSAAASAATPPRRRSRAASKLEAAEAEHALIAERRHQRVGALGSILRSASSVTIFAIAGVVILGDLGINLAPLLASAGVVGVAVGFGAQNLVRDYLSGIFMLLEDQYGVGDVITVGDATGTVETVNLRTTRLRDVNGIVWHIRNGTIDQVGNESQGWARAVIDFPVAYQADLSHIRDLLEKSAERMWRERSWRKVMIEKPEVWGAQEVSNTAVMMRIVARTAPLRQWEVEREMRARVKATLDEAGIAPPSETSALATSGAAGAVTTRRRTVTRAHHRAKPDNTSGGDS